MTFNEQPIGFFDSGFGGLTVFKEFIHALPSENLIYLADPKSLPLGNKPPEAVIEFSLKNAERLSKHSIKLLIIACHTACSHALEILKSKMPFPVLGISEPSIELVKEIQELGIIATKSTVDSGLYPTKLLQLNPKIKIYQHACPLLVPLIESGYQNHPSLELITRGYLKELPPNLRGLLLACTHYPLILHVIKKAMRKTTLIDPAKECAKQARELLKSVKILNESNFQPGYSLQTTGDQRKLDEFAKDFFKNDLEKVEKMENLWFARTLRSTFSKDIYERKKTNFTS